MPHGFAVWVECPLALTFRPGCCDTLVLDFQCVRADGDALPFPDASFTSVLAVMIHTDVEDYSSCPSRSIPGARSWGLFGSHRSPPMLLRRLC